MEKYNKRYDTKEWSDRRKVYSPANVVLGLSGFRVMSIFIKSKTFLYKTYKVNCESHLLGCFLFLSKYEKLLNK